MQSNIEARRLPGQERSRATLQSIMDAATRLIGEHGLDAISMTQIAELAGMSKASLYRYFPNKKALLLALAQQSFKIHREEMHAALGSGRHPEEMLRGGIDHYCRQHVDNPFLLHLRAAIHADPVLSEMDLKDSRENAALIVEFLSHHYPGLDQQLVQTRALLIVELLDSLARLIGRVSSKEQTKLIDEFVNLFLSDLSG